MLFVVLCAGCCGSGPGRRAPLSAAAFAERVEALSRAHRFTVVAVPPFVVVGGGSRAEVHAFSEDVVGWAVKHLQRDFFELHPSRIVEIWALRSTSSYVSWAGEAIGRAPASPYGVYAPCAGAIVVNRALGDGTLVHEMVHVFLEVNFPEAPTWFDEGLASLYEQPAERDGHIVGLVNWRLYTLKRRLLAGSAPSLRQLMTTTRYAFYADAGIHYAMARFLLFYLQEQGALRRFYRAFQQRGGDGIDVLELILGEPLLGIERRWRRFVFGLQGSQSMSTVPVSVQGNQQSPWGMVSSVSE